MRQQIQMVSDNVITGLRGDGEWVQVGRNALPLFNAGLVGTVDNLAGRVPLDDFLKPRAWESRLVSQGRWH